jgi:hypothetical protein
LQPDNPTMRTDNFHRVTRRHFGQRHLLEVHGRRGSIVFNSQPFGYSAVSSA